jgi:hypothetical protein
MQVTSAAEDLLVGASQLGACTAGSVSTADLSSQPA